MQRVQMSVMVLLVGLASGGSIARGDDSAALGGPKVAQPAAQSETEDGMMQNNAAAKPTIVRRNFQGDVEVIEDQRVEVAAVRALVLDEASKAKVDAFLTQRAALTSELTLEHYDLFIRLQGMFQGGEPQTAEARRERQAAVRELRQAVKPLLEPTLLDGLATQLHDEQAKQLREVVQEYRDATAEMRAKRRPAALERENTPKAKEASDAEALSGEDKPADATTRRDTLRTRAKQRLAEHGQGALQQNIEETAAVLREMARSFRGFIDERQDRLESLMAAVNATPEQRAAVDKIIRKNGEGAMLKPTQAQRAEMIRDVFALLTPEQRKLAREALRDGK